MAHSLHINVLMPEGFGRFSSQSSENGLQHPEVILSPLANFPVMDSVVHHFHASEDFQIVKHGIIDFKKQQHQVQSFCIPWVLMGDLHSALSY